MGEDQGSNDSDAIGTVGPKEIAGALEMKETVVSERGTGLAAANMSGIENYGEKKFVRRKEDGEGVSLRMHARMRRRCWGQFTT